LFPVFRLSNPLPVPSWHTGLVERLEAWHLDADGIATGIQEHRFEVAPVVRHELHGAARVGIRDANRRARNDAGSILDRAVDVAPRFLAACRLRGQQQYQDPHPNPHPHNASDRG
jgi:hypothetical protein